MSEHLIETRDGRVTTLTLARPEKKNALTRAMYAGLVEALARASADDGVRVVVIRGEGDAFSAGNDLADFAAANQTGRGGPGVGPAAEFIRAIARFEKPLVAAVQGFAVGVGATMLLHCDLVFVAEDAKLAMPFVGLALSPEAASSLLLPLRVGHVNAFSIFALGRPVVGAEAVLLGLANEAVPAADIRRRAAEAAAALAAQPPGAVRATKRLMRDLPAIEAAMEREFATFEERLVTAEAAEAFAAFREKRKPNFG